MPSTVALSSKITIADEKMKRECIRKVGERIGREKVFLPARKYASVSSEIPCDIIIQYKGDSKTKKCDDVIQYQGCRFGTFRVPHVIVNVFHYSDHEWVLVIGRPSKRVPLGTAVLPSETSRAYIVNIVPDSDFAETLLRIHNFCVFLLENYDCTELINEYINNSLREDSFLWPTEVRFGRFVTYCQPRKQYAEIPMKWEAVQTQGLVKVREQINGKNKGRCDKEFTTANKIVAEVEIGDLIQFERCLASAGARIPYKHWAVVVGRFMAPTKEENVYIVHYARADQEGPIILRFDKLKDAVGNVRINNLHDSSQEFYKRSVVEDEFGVLTRASEFMEKEPKYIVDSLNCEHMATFCRYGVGISVQTDNFGIFASGLTLGMYRNNPVLHNVYLAEFIYIFLVYLFSREESAVMFHTGVGVQNCMLLATIFNSLGSRTHFLFKDAMSPCNKIRLVLVVSVLSYLAFKSRETALICELGICYIAIARLGSDLLSCLRSIVYNHVMWINKKDKNWVRLGRFRLVTGMLLDGYQGTLHSLLGWYDPVSVHPLHKTIIVFRNMLMLAIVLPILSYTAFRSGFNNFLLGIAVIFIVVLILLSAEWIVVGLDRFATYCLYSQWYSETQMNWVAINREGTGVVLYFRIDQNWIRFINYKEQFMEERPIPFPSWIGSLKLRPVCSKNEFTECSTEFTEERTISFSSRLGNNISLRLQLKADRFETFTNENVTIFFPTWLIEIVRKFAVVSNSKKYPRIQYITMIFLIGLALLKMRPEFVLLMFTTVLYLWGELSMRCAAYVLLATVQSFATSIITTESTTFVAVSTYVVLAVAVMCKLKNSQYHIAFEESAEHKLPLNV